MAISRESSAALNTKPCSKRWPKGDDHRLTGPSPLRAKFGATRTPEEDMRRNLVLTLLIGLTAAAGGQSTAATQQGWQISGLPALNFNADEGFGYGVIAQAYNYGRGGLPPYQYMIQPLVFLATKGRGDADRAGSPRPTTPVGAA